MPLVHAPPEEGEEFDVVVVGSGFGGAVTARRLSDAGLSVCVLERGKAYAPGEFPRSPLAVSRAFWDPSAGLHGLFDYWSFRGLDALVAAGVGGGSLIYANVLLRKDPDSFAREGWPIGAEELAPGYARAEAELGPSPYPYAETTPKARAFAAAATAAGFAPFHPPLAVAWGSRPGEPLGEDGLHGALRETCRLCGECTVGCNFGAKHTLDLTYLALARASVHPRCEVRTLAAAPRGGYEIGYVHHPADREGRPVHTAWLRDRTVRARRVVLAGGALATTRLLLRNSANLPGLGPALGTRISGNGDLLAFARSAPQDLDPGHGPTITTALRGEDFWLEDAGLPRFLQWLVQAGGAPRTLWRYRAFARRFLPLALGWNVRTDMGHALSELLAPGRRAQGTLPLLGMGLDTPSGVLTLRGDHLALEWRTRESAAFFARLRDAARRVAEELGGTYADSPLWRLRRVVTVHPLGGTPMGITAQTGVVDPRGEVHGHPGLHVACGAALPGPVGPNPSLTIAAWAEHVAAQMLVSG